MTRKIQTRAIDSIPDLSSAIYAATGVGVRLSLDGKQDLLVSGANLRSINGFSLVGGGNVQLSPIDVGAAELVHTHVVADIAGLQAVLDTKAPAVHVHAISQVVGLQAALDGKAVAVHSHVSSDITDLAALLADKSDVNHVHAISQITGLQTVLTDLQNAIDSKAGVSHTHSLSALTASGASNGQVPTWNGITWIPQDPPSGGGGSYADAIITALIYG